MDEVFKRHALLAIATVIAVIAIMAAAMTSCADAQEVTYPGCSLDAVRITAPTFADGDRCYKVTDRTDGTTWYLIEMYGSRESGMTWVVLPK